jgi:arylsulfatase A-like enzyme
MRILYIDIDTLRPDHLGCYGYHRPTSPNLDRIATQGVRFTNCYVSDAPCLPSRAALYSGKCGIRNGAINHGGEAADPYVNPDDRQFRRPADSYTMQLRRLGYYPVTVSPFGERHSSFWFYEGFREMYNTGKGGGESAEEVVPIALDWLDRRGQEDNWYLHVNVWDPHTPYRAPESIGNPFAGSPPPAWMNEELRRKSWDNYGPGSAQEPGGGYVPAPNAQPRPRQPLQIDSMASYRHWIDGYDCGVYHADLWVGQLMDKLEELGILDDTLIVVSSDHGENQGELGIFGDHQVADHITNRVPMIVRHPKGLGGRGRVDDALHYQFDITATLIEMLGGEVPTSWDGTSFYAAFEERDCEGREFLVVANCAWACQRSVRWSDYLLMRTYHSGFHNFPDLMLFDVANDPHELNDMSLTDPALVHEGLAMLERWTADEMRRSQRTVDPMWIAMREGGPFHARFTSPSFERYVQRLRETGRAQHAADLERRRQRLTTWPH